MEIHPFEGKRTEIQEGQELRKQKPELVKTL
jgi:hypothetical protein